MLIEESPDYEGQSSYAIRLQTTDPGGLSFEQSVVLQVIDVDESPPPPPVADGSIGEYGKIENLDHKWQTITWTGSYVNPVVMVSDPSFNGSDPAAVRLRNVGPGSFEIRVAEPSNKDDIHGLHETVSYVVMEAGVWELSDGTRIEAGSTPTDQLSSQGATTVNLSGAFSEAPVVLSQVQTNAEAGWLATRTGEVTAGSFDLRLQEEEASNGGSHVEEVVGWIAISAGAGSDGDTALEVGLTGEVYTDSAGAVGFQQTFSSEPSLIAKIGSYNGGDPSNLRIEAVDGSGFTARVYEDTTKDEEIVHIEEAIAYWALEGLSGSIDGTAVGDGPVPTPNEAPTALNLSATSFEENIAAGAEVAVLSSSDPNPSDTTFTYCLLYTSPSPRD